MKLTEKSLTPALKCVDRGPGRPSLSGKNVSSAIARLQHSTISMSVFQEFSKLGNMLIPEANVNKKGG
jgi:hypothetical protein